MVLIAEQDTVPETIDATLNYPAEGETVSVSHVGAPGAVDRLATEENARYAEAIHRKLRAVIALLRDPAATEHERANAEALKARLETQLRQAGRPEGAWTDAVFRLGRAVREMKQSTSRPAPMGDWTDNAFRLGRTLRRGFKMLRKT
jgi:hypothetical protein